MVESFTLYFAASMEQVAVIAPGVDFFASNAFQFVKDGEIVDEEYMYTTSLNLVVGVVDFNAFGVLVYKTFDFLVVGTAGFNAFGMLRIVEFVEEYLGWLNWCLGALDPFYPFRGLLTLWKNTWVG
ncbi:hypothetical protein VNO78_10661 [Psophocarpus tetragonolobus]|uniref:Uncharacterized protein n=1 Tax=Psophocarpus tetragonolobus TaxID=3891 RepID=A0AAN9SRS7_PSOTE